MAKRIDRKVQKLFTISRQRRQSLKLNPPPKGVKKTLADINRPLIDKLQAQLDK